MLTYKIFGPDHPAEVFARITGVRKLFGRRQGISRCWMLSTPYVLISKPECVEVNRRNFQVSYGGGSEKRFARKLMKQVSVLSRSLRSMLTTACGQCLHFLFSFWLFSTLLFSLACFYRGGPRLTHFSTFYL